MNALRDPRRGRRLVLAALLLVGCNIEAKQEADSLVRAMERFRKAENKDKPELIGLVKNTKCSAADVCSARAECLAYADATARALVLKRDVELSLLAVESGAVPKDSEEAKALPRKLDEAEKLLKEGFGHLEPCDGALMGLRRTYRL